MLRPPHVEQRQQQDRKETQQALEDSAHVSPRIMDRWSTTVCDEYKRKLPPMWNQGDGGTGQCKQDNCKTLPKSRHSFSLSTEHMTTGSRSKWACHCRAHGRSDPTADSLFREPFL